MKSYFSLLLSIALLFSTLPVYAEDYETKSEEKIFLKNNTAKLYRILKLIDDRRNWLQVSELLREILASNLDDSFIRAQLSKAKREIDREPIVNFLKERVVDWPFVVAKLRIIEVMMANHPRFNISYDHELALVKGLIQSYFFPGFENEGEIIFPNPRTYHFDLYGYVRENILKTETAPSGQADDPRFPENQKSRFSADGNVEVRRFDRLRERADDTHGKADEVAPKDIGKDIETIQDTLEKTKGLFGGALKEIEDLVKVTRVIDQYEPWGLLLTGIINPEAAQYDPQLKDFLSGVKLKLKLGTYDYHPEQWGLIKEIFSDQVDYGLEIQEEVRVKDKQVSLYVLSNLTSPEMISLRSLIYLKKFIDFQKCENGAKVASMVTRIASLLDRVAKWEIEHGRNWILTAGAYATRTAAAGGNFLLGSEGIVAQVVKWDRFQALVARIQKHPLAKNERYFKLVIALTMATDLAEGMVRIMGARDGYDKIDAVQETLAKEAASFLYVLPLVSQKAIAKYAGWGALGLDIGHWISPNIPRSSQVIQKVVFDYGLNILMDHLYGKTFKDMLVEDYEGKLNLSPFDFSVPRHKFDEVIASSQDAAQLIAADEIFSQAIRSAAQKRLLMVYYVLQRWNNRELEEVGDMEQRYFKTYEEHQNEMKKTRQAFTQRFSMLTEKEESKRKEKEELLRKIREQRYHSKQEQK